MEFFEWFIRGAIFALFKKFLPKMISEPLFWIILTILIGLAIIGTIAERREKKSKLRHTPNKKNEKCHNHPQKDALSFCISCKKYFCADCLTKVSEYYCCGSENCKNILENQIKEALHSAIASESRSLADNIVGMIDGNLTNIQEAFNVMAVYVEIIFVCLHEVMNIVSQNLDEEERDLFFGEIYLKIRDALANKYSPQISMEEFQAYFNDTFRERRMEYKNFVGLNPSSHAEDLQYMSFGKKISAALRKDFDLETDANIQNLYLTAFFPLVLVRKYLESLNDLKKNTTLVMLKSIRQKS